MTPQLMQAIKLLQLSNLDLVAYVEAELERNPLLDRSAEDEPAPAEADGRAIAGPARPQTARPWNAQRAARPTGSAIEERLDTAPRRRFPGRRRADPPARRRRPGRIFGMGRRRRRRPRRRRLQSRSVRFRRNHAGRLAARAAHARHHRSGAAHDRAISDRSGRRGRLSRRRFGCGRGEARHQRQGSRSRARHSAELRSARRLRARSRRMPGDPAQGARPLRSGNAGADRAARSAGQARFRHSEEKYAASATKISPT